MDGRIKSGNDDASLRAIAKQSSVPFAPWIASSPTLLAMTKIVGLRYRAVASRNDRNVIE